MVGDPHGSHCLDRKMLNSANFASFQPVPVGSGLFYQHRIFCLLKIVCKTKYYFDQKRVLSSAPGSRLTSTQLDHLTVKLSRLAVREINLVRAAPGSIPQPSRQSVKH